MQIFFDWVFETEDSQGNVIGEFDLEVVVNVYSGEDADIDSCSYFSDYWQKRIEFDLTQRQTDILVDKAIDLYYDQMDGER